MPKAERAALINADAKLGASGRYWAIRIPAQCAAPRDCASFGQGQAAVPGGRCTGRSGGSSW